MPLSHGTIPVVHSQISIVKKNITYADWSGT